MVLARVRRGVLACLVCVLLLAAGCVRATPTPEPATITFAFLDSGRAYYEPLVAEFNQEYPYITVDLDDKPRRGAHILASADVALGGDWLLSGLLDQGAVADLDALIEQDAAIELEDFYPGAIEHFTRQGKMWAIPAGLDGFVIFYNQDLFDRYGISYPGVDWTRQDFEEIVRSMRDPEGGVFGYGSPHVFLDVVLFVYAHGGRLFDDLYDPTRATFDDPLTVEALEWYFRLMFDYDAIPTQEEVRAWGADVYAGFANNKVGMVLADVAQAGGGDPAQPWTMRWGMVPVPQDAARFTVGMVKGYLISASTPYPDACWKWVQFLSHRSPERLIPARKSVLESTEYEKRAGAEFVRAVRATMRGRLLNPVGVSSKLEPDMQLFERAIDSIVSQEATPQEAMTWAQRQAALK